MKRLGVFFVRLMRVFVLVALVLPLAACADFRNKCWPPIPHRAYEVCPQYDVSNPALRMAMKSCIPGTKRCVRACGPDYDAKLERYNRCLEERNRRAQEGFVMAVPAPGRAVLKA